MGASTLLQHLCEFEPEIVTEAPRTPYEKATPAALVDAMHETAEFLASLGVPDDAEAEQKARTERVTTAFKALTTALPDDKQRKELLNLKTPHAVRHLTAMLTAYDWEFVEKAAELRGYAVAGILQETKHPDARIRLRAFEMLGRVTEVALFTDRVEVKKTDLSEEALEEKFQQKMQQIMQMAAQVGAIDVPMVEVVPKKPDDTHPAEQ